MSQQATTDFKVSEHVANYAAYFVKFILLPALLFYANNLLENISKSQDKIEGKQETFNDKITALQVSLAEYKISHDKDRELFDYRLSTIEERCDELYEQVYPRLADKQKSRGNSSRVGK